MTSQRKYAYRWLLYWAMLETRNLCQSRGTPTWNPLEWYRQYQRSRYAGALSDWLHNMALFSAHDFQDFDEDRFWREHDYLAKRFPRFYTAVYKEKFDGILNQEKPNSL